MHEDAVVPHRNTGVCCLLPIDESRRREIDVIGLPTEWWQAGVYIHMLELVEAAAPLGAMGLGAVANFFGESLAPLGIRQVIVVQAEGIKHLCFVAVVGVDA